MKGSLYFSFRHCTYEKRFTSDTLSIHNIDLTIYDLFICLSGWC